MTIAEKKQAVLAAHGLEANLVSATELRVLEPELRSGLAGGLKVPGESVVFSPSVVRYFLDTVRAKGGALWSAIVSKIEDGRVHLADGSSLQSPCIVNAAGTAAALIQDFPEDVPRIRPRKGQLLITARYPGFCEHEIVELGYMKSAHSGAGSSVACNIQARPGGQVLVGSCRSFGDTSRDVDWGLLARMMQRSRRFLPRLGDLQVLRTWVGFRAASDDKLPMIGKLPGSDTLYLACGHEGLGMTTALATGELLAAEIRGAATKIDSQPYRPCRLTGSTGSDSQESPRDE